MVNFNENVNTRRGERDRDHIPALPFWVAIIRVFQLVFAFLVVVLAGFASNVFGGTTTNNLFEGFSMSFFTFAWTVLFLLYIFITPLFFPKWYLYWAHLGLEFLTMLFWLVSFALLADEKKYLDGLEVAIDAVQSLDGEIAGATGLDPSSLPDSFPGIANASLNKLKSAIKCAEAAMGLAVINWLLFLVTLGVFSYFIHKHRKANGKTGFGGLTFVRNQDVEKYPAGASPQVQVPQQVELQEQHQHSTSIG